jgi:hypothetical protein
MKLVLTLALFAYALPAAAASRYCFDRNNGDYLIVLELDGDRVVRATFSNQDHGTYDDRELAPSEYAVSGNSVLFEGDEYLCD